ncbi:MAG: glycosyltransferase [Planctomycetota bacterium]|nr:glycosyltransferase [Planctomycetota bacterium]
MNPIVNEIPNIIHFCFGFTADFGGKPFSLIHYLAIRSAVEIQRPDIVRFMYKHEPDGEWWQRAKRLVELVPIEPPEEIFGKPLLHPAHRADVVRLQALHEYGGIYLDVDVLCLRPFDELRHHKMVMGQEADAGLCNAVILAQPNSDFIARWLDEFRSFRSRGRDAFWGEHAVKVPARLAGEYPDEIHIVGPERFFWPMYWPDHLSTFFSGDGSSAFCDDSYCVHLWEQLSWESYLRDLVPDQIRCGQSEFDKLARPFLD